jgi:hypothetical protein
MTKIITVGKDGFVYIEDFRDIVNIDIIAFYRLKTKKDGSVVLKFYDKKKKLVRPYERK